jgi:hypothetical protein
METKLTKAAREELARAVRTRYQAATGKAKHEILSEFIAISGYHPKYAIEVLNREEFGPKPPQERKRPRLYDDAAKQALIVLWEASDRICGKRLRPLLRTLLPSLERHGHLQLDAAVRAKVLAMGAATIDRLLREPKATRKKKKPRTCPELRRRIPVRTFADWKEPPPGSMEMDLVAHCDGVSRGSYVHSLVLTDINSAWTECAPLVVREKTVLIEALERVRVSLPFPLRALDVDNGGEFINEDLIGYCVNHGIELTRSRPYRKNDQAWIEQKNGAVVRQMVGYRRFEGIAAAQMLARLYASLRFFVNFFQPSFKLMEKFRTGSQVTKHYHPPQTPAERLLASETIPAPMKARLRTVQEQLDPLRLLEEIRAVQANLVVLADGEQPYEPKPQERDLAGFLASLSSAWRAGEIRPTHIPPGTPPKYLRSVQIVVPPPEPIKVRTREPSAVPHRPPPFPSARQKPPEAATAVMASESKPERDDGQKANVSAPSGRRRKRPFAFRSIWPMIRERLEAKPKLNASELFDQLRAEYPGRYHPGQADTLGRLVRVWRVDAAARGLPVRPLNFRKYGKPRYWRTRVDPIESVWPEMCVSLEADPDQTVSELFEEFQTRYPGQYDRQFRTLQRRVQGWRQEATHRLVFGVADASFALPAAPDQSRGGEEGG